jgi:CheY-like chemotaxis protein
VPRILIAEGHATTRELLQRSLAAAGLEPIAAGDAPTALSAWTAQRPDALVVATDLPGLEELARRLREIDPRVLLVLADRGHLGRARGMAPLLPLKANGYVADPTAPELAEKLTRLIRQAAAARARLRGVPLVMGRAPAAQGEVKPGVVARLIHQIWRSLGDGALVLVAQGHERRLFFLRGQPVACEASDPAESLVGWMAAAGRLDLATRRGVEAAMAGGLAPAAALVAAGALQPGEPQAAALRAHLRALLVKSVGARQGSWRFHGGDEFAAQLPTVEVLPLQPVLEGARTHVPVKHFADALKAVLAAYPSRTADYQRLLPTVGLGAADLRLAQGLDGRSTTKQFLEASKAELSSALSLLWFLSMVGAVVFHDTPEPETPGAVAPAARRPPLPADRAEAIRQAALRILPGTYFHALGVDIAADDAEIERAWREVSARFDRDGLAEYEVGDLADLLRAVQDKVAAAWAVLGKAEKRRQYLSFLLLKFELSGVRRPGIDLDAEVALKRGERALRARRNAEAVSALHEAVARNPREPEYLAMLAFAELHDPVLPPLARAEEARGLARRALELDPSHPRAGVVLALAEELAGDHRAAQEAVLAALRAHPYGELAKRVQARLSARAARARQPPDAAADRDREAR